MDLNGGPGNPHPTPVVLGVRISVRPRHHLMKSIRDCFGRLIRLTDERMAHILQHPEMIGMEAEIVHVLQRPAEVRLSRSDSTVQLFYEYYVKTRVGGKWLCAVVKYAADDGFVVTAYLTDQLKPGERLWPKK